MLATWALIFAAFVYEPGWIRDSLRFMTHSIESLADQVPEPWGARLEIMLRELGGMIWIQIASAIVLLRLIIWVPFHIWRLRRQLWRTIQAGEYLTVQHPERRPFRRLPPQLVKLMTQNPVLSLKRGLGPGRSDQRQPD